ncbi:Kelch-like protein 21 [Paramyrothecium foliicola]|nr:Kelch-like protein 21 [Paramyrothecium foliicola]
MSATIAAAFPQTEASESPYDIYHYLESLFMNQRYADLTIRCGGQDFHAHRAIVCPQSTFLAAACDGTFREAEARMIELPDERPEILTRFLRFLYTGIYDDSHHHMSEHLSTKTMTPSEIERELEREPGMPDLSTGDSVRDEDGQDLDEAEEENEAPQLLARRTFQVHAEAQFMQGHFDDPDFPAVVDELFDTTLTTDPVRLIPCNLVAIACLKSLPAFDSILDVMARNGEFGVGVAQRYRLLYNLYL